MRRQAAVLTSVALLLLGFTGPARAQARPKPVAPPVQTPPAPATQAAKAPAQPPAPAPQVQTPSEATLGVPFHPTMQFIESYDAGSGQRFFLFGTTASFAEVVEYYKSALKQRGELVFEEPPTHMFEIGKFREETMAFPPSITLKDYTWGGMAGYPNPKPNAEPARFRTVVQIVPIPAATPEIKR
jgi:hypothetical protein